MHIADTFPYKLVPDIPTPLSYPGSLVPSAWEKLLAPHPDKLYTHTITQIIKYGARIGYTGPDQLILSANLPSANSSTDTLEKDILDQRSHNRLALVADPKQLKRFISSPHGLVPKPGQTNAWRRIHHLSSPPGRSDNDYIPNEWGTLEYATFDEAVAMVAAAGQGATLIKRDLADAFRHIPIAPEDYWLLGFHWGGTYWIDCFLPFGLRTSPFIFDLFAKGLHFLLEAEPAIAQSFSILHYLDDFFAAGLPGVSPSIYESRFANLCMALGLPIKESKSVTGTTAEYGGIEFDTLAMEARLPQAKLLKAQKLLTTLWPQKTTTLSELQSLIGYLCFCSKVIPIGRSFLRHLYNATTGHKSKRTTTRGQPIPVTDNMRLDLRWWRDFLPQWNCITLIHKNRKTIYLWTDASGTKGQGAYFTDTLNGDHLVDWEHAFSKTISRHHRHKDINYLEMHTVLLALQRWHLHFADCQLVIHTDNTTVLSGLRRLSV